MTEVAGSKVPPAAKSSWLAFLKSVASFNGDIASLTAPAFILSPQSLTEFSAYWSEMPHLFVAPAKEKDPQQRMYLVVKWFLSTLRQQYDTRNEKYGTEKKPLNPFLGELFLGKWDDEQGTTHLISEQVSHHPPVTAYSIWNKDHGVSLQGYSAQKVTFTTTFNVKQIGHAIIHIDEFDEDYLITLPPLSCEGLLSGSPYMELTKHNYIVSSSGYTAKMEYSGKGWITGTKHLVSAAIFPTGKESHKTENIWTAEGAWSKKITFKKGPNVVEVYNAQTEKTTPLDVAPIEEQDPIESRRAWKKVAAAINKGDMATTSHEKSIIEVEQRELRKKEAAEGVDWPRRFFSRAMGLPVFDKLSKEVPHVTLDAEHTNGIWVFDQEKAAGAKPPFQELSKVLLAEGR